MPRVPDRRLSLDKYRQGVAAYDDANRFRRLRRIATARLELQPGDVVLDVACGTGLNFPLLEDGIGPQGSLIGVDQSPDMLAVARDRVARHEWRNVTLINSSAEDARISAEIDAVLLFLTHDVMRSPAALQNVMRSVKQGAPLVAAGSKWAAWWAWPINIGIWYGARRYTTTFEGFSRPWSHLSSRTSKLEVESYLRGAMYVAWGRRS